MNFLTNPVMIRMAVGLVAGVMAFVIGITLVRKLRRSILEEAVVEGDSSAIGDNLPLHTYNAVIQQLKQQKHELQSQQQVERRRAKTSENISAAVLSNLSCGVLFVTPNGIVRQANAAARHILGFASPVGMGLEDLFRDAEQTSREYGDANLAEAVAEGIKQKMPFQKLESKYVRPAGAVRMLELTLTSVQSSSGEQLGSACLINDQTELACIRQEEELRNEMSAEMALELRKSLAAISDTAKRLSESRDGEQTVKLAADIASEADHLNQTIGGFLASAKAVGAVAGA